MKTKLFFLILVSELLFDISIAQNLPDSSQSVALVNLFQKYPGNFASHWNNKTGTPDVITFSHPLAFAKDQKNSAANFLKEVSGILKQRASDDNLVFTENKIDDKGIGYFRFDQTYKEIPVIGGEYGITVLPNNCIQLALGSFIKNIIVNTSPSITPQQALQAALQNRPSNIFLKDSLLSSRLVVFPQDSVNYLSWELKIPTNNIADEWIYYVDALTGRIIDHNSLAYDGVQNNLFTVSRKTSYQHNLAYTKRVKSLTSVTGSANVYLSSPLDGGYVPVTLYNLDVSGYLEGTYAYIINDATYPGRAYSPQENFSYDPSVTQFDEANLYYQVDLFRSHYWNQMGFSGFQQITAYCHYPFSSGPNSNELNGIIYFSDDQGDATYRSFVQEAKFVYHEYTHAVEHYFVSFPYQQDQECCAIDEGNADYFASSYAATLIYYTSPTAIGHWSDYQHPEFWRDILNPRITTYAEYNDQTYWTNHHISPFKEPHYGGEFWSFCLWDLRNAFGNTTSDRDIYYALSPSLPTTSTFYQYEQAIITADINHFNGINAEETRHLFYLRGIGFDSLELSITGPGYLNSKQWGTYTANITGGSGSVTYQWYNSDDGGTTWYTDGTAQTQSLMMFNSDFIVRCDVHDTQTGENKSTNMTVHYGPPPPKIGTALNNKMPLIFRLEQNFPDPFNPSTIIHYEIPNDGLVTLKIYDELGREVKTLVNQYQNKGKYDINFNASNLASGVYFYQLHASTGSAQSFISTKKLILLK